MDELLAMTGWLEFGRSVESWAAGRRDRPRRDTATTNWRIWGRRGGRWMDGNGKTAAVDSFGH